MMNVKWSFAVFLLCAHGIRAAVVPRPENTVNTHGNLPVESEVDRANSEENEIGDERDSLYGLYPPKVKAKDYYYSKSSYPKKNVYVIDTVKKVLKLDAEGGPQETKLKPIEEMEIRKLSAAFANILVNSKLENYDWGSPTQTEPSSTESSTTEDWKKLSPIITLSNSGVSIEFGSDTTTHETEERKEAAEGDSLRDSLWDTLSKSVDKALFNELDRRLNMTEDDTTEDIPTDETPAEEETSSFDRFLSSVWNMIRTSFDYVKILFSSLFVGKEESNTTTAVSNSTDVPVTTDVKKEEDESITVSPTTTAAVFAYEEPTRYRSLPAEEFETRRRDIDSFFYGYGNA